MLHLTWWDKKVHVTYGKKFTICLQKIPQPHGHKSVTVAIYHGDGKVVKFNQGLCFEPGKAFCGRCVRNHPIITNRWRTMLVD